MQKKNNIKVQHDKIYIYFIYIFFGKVKWTQLLF